MKKKKRKKNLKQKLFKLRRPIWLALLCCQFVCSELTIAFYSYHVFNFDHLLLSSLHIIQ